MSPPQTRLRVRVARKRMEAQDICSLELVGSEAPLPAFTAGAHLDVLLPNGQVRQYSLCNDPAEGGRYLIAVLREARSRGGSLAVHDGVDEGAVLEVSEPRNHFALNEQAPRHLLLAGGIGVTPILAMAERLTTLGADFELHYCTRARERTAFAQRIAQSRFASRAHHHYDNAPAATAQGPLDLPALLRDAPAGTELYVCGPQGFMEAVLSAARAQGWPEESLHYEFFGAAQTNHSADGPFELELARSGRVVPVAAGQTALNALLEAGIDVPMSCEQGVCGTCLTRVLAGVPDHRDHYLTPEEQAVGDQFLPCCSRSKSPRLVLDL